MPDLHGQLPGHDGEVLGLPGVIVRGREGAARLKGSFHFEEMPGGFAAGLNKPNDLSGFGIMDDFVRVCH